MRPGEGATKTKTVHIAGNLSLPLSLNVDGEKSPTHAPTGDELPKNHGTSDESGDGIHNRDGILIGARIRPLLQSPHQPLSEVSPLLGRPNRISGRREIRVPIEGDRRF